MTTKLKLPPKKRGRKPIEDRANVRTEGHKLEVWFTKNEWSGIEADSKRLGFKSPHAYARFRILKG